MQTLKIDACPMIATIINSTPATGPANCVRTAEYPTPSGSVVQSAHSPTEHNPAMVGRM